MYLVPDSDSAPEPVNVEERKLTEYTDKSGRHVEIHSDKWHRCINHVKGRRGGGKYNAYAVCTASIGKAGSFAKGHGGRAKAKTKEADLREFNDCHDPETGEFCSASGVNLKDADRVVKVGGKKYAAYADDLYNTKPYITPSWRSPGAANPNKWYDSFWHLKRAVQRGQAKRMRAAGSPPGKGRPVGTHHKRS